MEQSKPSTDTATTKSVKKTPMIMAIIAILAVILIIAIAVILRIGFADSADKEHAYLAKDTFVRADGTVSTLEDAMNSVIADADSYMNELGVSSENRALVKADLKEQMYYLQDETEKRILGDHGILHVFTNWQKAKNYLATRPDVDTTTRLEVLVANVYHDTGYGVYPCNEPVTSEDFSTDDHDLFSAVIEESDDTIGIYREIFTEQQLSDMLYAVRTHNSENIEIVNKNTAADSNIIALTLNLADKCGLAIRDKTPSSLDNCPDAYQAMIDYYTVYKDEADKYETEFEEKFGAAIEEEQLDPHQKESYLQMKDAEASISDDKYNPKYYLRMLFGYTMEDCIKYNPETNQNEITLYRVTYGLDGEKKLQKKMLSKLIEDLVPQEQEESDDDYDDRIEELYDMACEEEGLLLDSTRGLRVIIKEIPAEEIPGSEKDYLKYNIVLK